MEHPGTFLIGVVGPCGSGKSTLIAGLELNYGRLKPRLAAMARLGATTVLLMYAMLGPVIWAIWPWLPILPEASGITRVALATLVTTTVVSFSPTVTIAVIADTRSRGPLSEMVLAVVVLADLALIVLFTLTMQMVTDDPMGPALSLNFAAVSGRTYEIQATSDFQTWTTVLTTNSVEGGPIAFSEPKLSTPGGRFFRVVEY